MTPNRYSGGEEGNTVVSWFCEVDGMEGCGTEDHHFQVLPLVNPNEYVPTVEDINKRIKIQITPVRADGVEGPTYQHILDALRCPQRVQDDVGRCVRQMQSKGGNFVLGQVDEQALHLPAVPKRVAVADGALKIKNVATDKTEFKVKLEPGCMRTTARPDVPNLLTLTFFATRSNPTPRTFAMLAEDVRSRDVVVLVMRSLA